MPFKYKGRKKEYMKEYHKEWLLKNSERIGEVKYKYRTSEMGFLTSLISSLFTPSKLKDRGYIPECTKEEIKNHYNEHVKKYGRNCFYCLEPWTYIRKKYIPGCGKNYKTFIQNSKNLSIDRLDNDKTYSINNIFFCCTICNSSKNRISIKLIKRLNEVIKDRGL
jgi:superoxide dismutase